MDTSIKTRLDEERSENKEARHPILKMKGISAVLVATLLLLSITVVVTPASAADVLCGTTISADTTLHEDLNCGGNGLTIGASGITVDLNGHTINGSGSGSGISTSFVGGPKSDLTIKDGTITNFENAIFSVGLRTSVISNIEATSNAGNAIFLIDSNGNLIQNVQTTNNVRNTPLGAIGIFLLRGSDNVVEGSTSSGNNAHGILLIGSVRNTIRDNTINDNDANGINVANGSNNNLVEDNELSGNGVGISAPDRAAINLRTADNNIVRDNVVQGNRGTGILLSLDSDNNLIIDNVFRKNGHGPVGLTRGGITIGSGSDGNLVINNRIQQNGGNGIFVSLFPGGAGPGGFTDPQSNFIISNKILANSLSDVLDVTVGIGTGGTANTYLANVCTGSTSPVGLC